LDELTIDSTSEKPAVLGFERVLARPLDCNRDLFGADIASGLEA
jgi:hypothetical protein